MDFNYSNSYISNLNIEAIESPSETSNSNSANNDLSLFSNDEFFNFDVFANDEFAFKETKQEQQQQLLKEEQQDDERLINALLSTKNSDNSNEFSIPSFPDTSYAVDNTVSAKQGSVSPSVSHSHIISTDARIGKDGTMEDKRKRNTLASARFRIKKKLKEQKMEQELKELTFRVNDLKATVMKLEMENKCLKNLVIEKNEKKSDELLSSIKKNAGV